MSLRILDFLRPIAGGALIAAVVFSASAAGSSLPAAALSGDGPPTLIIDAGHGGADGGAVSPDGMLESVINLDIALRLELLAGLIGSPCVMTRESEAIDYPAGADSIAAKKKADQKARVALIRSVPNAVLISIHQNIYPSPLPRGAQVLYGVVEGSEELGVAMHEALALALYPENRRVAAPISDSIYLMKNADCPAILIECGFLSNREEAALLDTPEYRLKIAAAVISAYWRYI